MIFTLFRKKVVNIEPLKMQAENRLDITYTLRSFERSEKTTIPHYPSHRKSQRFSHKDFQNNFLFRKKTPLTLDCLNRSLKGLSINLKGDVDVYVSDATLHAYVYVGQPHARCQMATV